MQHHHRSLLFIGLAGALAAAGQAYASGLQITEQSVTGLGRAFAGGSLPNDDVSAVFYNPADMMLSNGMQAQAGLTLISIDMKTENTGSTTRLPANLGDVLTKPGTLPVFVTIPSFGRGNDDGGTDNVVPNAFFAMDINDRMRFGLGMTAPFAVSTSYGRDWVGRYHAVDSELTTADINPSIAYRINQNFSLGAGVSAQYVDATLSNALFNPTTPFVKDGYGETKANGWAFGYNLGALYEIDSNTRFSASYRSRINHSAEGDRTISNYWRPELNGKVSAKADVTLPDWLGLAAYHRIDNQWAVMSGVRWTNWSLFQKLQIDYADGSRSLTVENWEDTWAFNIGVSYDYNPAWTFRAGYVYDQTPVPSAEYRTPRIPDSNRNAFSVGFSYRPMPQMSLDFGYMYIDFADASTDNTINLLPVPPFPSGLAIDNLNLNYTGSGNLVGIQASYRF
jgi:long-chain fatty acid transport protein